MVREASRVTRYTSGGEGSKGPMPYQTTDYGTVAAAKAAMNQGN